jgi:putative oxidoreductase
MQRLFSTFPNSWPGLGLLVLRFIVAGGCIVTEMHIDHLNPWISLLHCVAIAGAGLLAIGLWTPLVALLLAGALLWSGITRHPVDAIPLILTAIAVSMSMLGPGAWSVDAVLFGRKKIDIGGDHPVA